jgi:Protein of unknown function (DUF1592)/Protein of unknown function (DUF1588)/Protein of unknown function (DUF1595)/Protein of unknown function (DUF1585)
MANPDGKAPTEATVGPSPLRRLGQLELSQTVRALLPGLPDSFDAGKDLPPDNGIALSFAEPGTVSDVEVNRFMDLGEAAVAALGDKSPSAQAACSGDETACARAFVQSFGKRAFRRPVDQLEEGDLLALYGKLRTDPEMTYDFKGALGVLVEAILQSPGFIYRWERGLQAPLVDGKLVKYDSYEVASRLSYFLWSSMPDDALLAAADANQLSTPDQVAAQAARLLADPRADLVLGDFASQWLELTPLPALVKDTGVFPGFTPALRDAMQAETLAFTRDVLRGATPTFTSLLTANYTIAQPALAQYYGVTADASGRADLSGTGRLGLLTQASVMSVKGNSYRTSPVRRGKFVLNRMLCSSVPPPPANVVPDLPAPDKNKTLREQMAEHRTNPTCAACHDSMDPLGFAFEHFDGAGKFRELDGTQAIDPSGSVSLDGATVSFKDAADLAKLLAASPEAQHCFTRQWLRYALDRFEQDADSAAAKYLEDGYVAAGLDTRKLIVDVTRTLPFSHRAPAEGEVLTP